MVHRLCLAAFAAVLAGCSGGKPVVEECFDEFVQEFELITPGWVAADTLCKQQEHELSHPEAYRDRVSLVRVEYSEGDYYVVQTDRYWSLSMGEPGEDDDKYCKAIEPHEQITVLRFEEDELDAELFLDGEPTAPLSSFMENALFGEKRLTRPNWQDAGVDDAEDTDFKLRCAMTERSVVGRLSTPACMPVEPVKACASVRSMLPIHQEGRTDFGMLRAKTTKLEMGKVGTLVDKSTWSLESDEAE